MTLYPFQQVGVNFLTARRRAYLGDEMGLGKSVQALAAAERLGLRYVLMLGPAATLGNWQREAEVWAPSVEVAPVSYSTAIRRPIVGSDWDAVILDEAHYCKNPRAKRTKVALGAAAAAPHAWLLSGTPMPNSGLELWSTFHYLWPELIPPQARTHGGWMNYFCRWTPTRYGPRVHGHKNAAVLKRMLETVMLRRRVSDVDLGLPPLRVTLHSLTNVAGWKLSEDDESLLEWMLREEGRGETSSHSRIRRLLGTLKASAVADVIAEELDDEQYRKIVVLYHHTDVGDRLEARLKKFGTVRMDGRTPATARQDIIDRFNTRPGVRVFLGQQMAAGTGLNLQAAHEIVLVEPDWVPDMNRQAIKRVHRIGQDSPVRARIFGVRGTIDEAVMAAAVRKTTAQEEVGLR